MSEVHATSLAEQLLDVEAAARLLNVKPSTVYQWVRDGAMPCLRLGPRAIRFTRPMLEAWLASRLETGRSAQVLTKCEGARCNGRPSPAQRLLAHDGADA